MISAMPTLQKQTHTHSTPQHERWEWGWDDSGNDAVETRRCTKCKTSSQPQLVLVCKFCTTVAHKHNRLFAQVLGSLVLAIIRCSLLFLLRCYACISITNIESTFVNFTSSKKAYHISNICFLVLFEMKWQKL